MKSHLMLSHNQIDLLLGAVEHETRAMHEYKHAQASVGGHYGVGDAISRIDGLKKLNKKLKKLKEAAVEEARRNM